MVTLQKIIVTPHTSGVAEFDHDKIDDVAVCICHATICGVAKMSQIQK